MSHKGNENQVSQPSSLGTREKSPFTKSSATKTPKSTTTNYHSEMMIDCQKNGSNGDYISPTPDTTSTVGAHIYQSGRGSYRMGTGVLSADQDVRQARERDHKKFAELNDTFANYIENVRFLAAQNESLNKDYDLLTIGLSEDVKSMEDVYTGRLMKAEDMVKTTNRQQREIEVEIQKLKQELDNIRKKYEHALSVHESEIDDTREKLSAVLAEIAMFKCRIEILETITTARLNKEKDHIKSELERASIALEKAMHQRSEYKSHLEKYDEENRKIDNHRKTHDKAFIGMQIRMLRGMSPEDREFFKRELAKAISDIRSKYDDINEQHRTEMESEYLVMVQNVQWESIKEHEEQEHKLMEIKELELKLSTYQKKFSELNSHKSLLKAQEEDLISTHDEYLRLNYAEMKDCEEAECNLDEECEALKEQLRLLPSVDFLESGLARYKDIIESEESRVAQLQHAHAEARNCRENDASVTTIKQTKTSGVQMAEIQHESSRGDVLIRDDNNFGRYIILENVDSLKEKKMSEWKLKRKVDSKPEIEFQLPKDFVLKPGKSVKIWTRSHGGVDNPPEELIWKDGDSFGVGLNVKTILTDKYGNVDWPPTVAKVFVPTNRNDYFLLS